jgi:hypothetical protein
MAAPQPNLPVPINERNKLFIQSMILEPVVNRQDRRIYNVRLITNLSDGRRYVGISRDDELSFFYKLNHLLYILEKKNIQDIIHLRGINGDIYNVLNYLFVKYKKNNAIRKKIIQFINVNFYLPRG